MAIKQRKCKVDRKMKTLTDKMRNKIILGLVILSIILGFLLGINRFYTKEKMKQELQLNSLFLNIEGLKVTTDNSSIWSNKPYKKIVIKIPSIASKNDDATNQKEAANKVNKVIDREKLDEGFANWIEKIFNKKETQQYTDEIEIWYRDNKIISETYK
ncbi:hypothetical protein [Streptococcus zalophi]|uniref:hypothetical protein n=1 Tax=Streptococcus zalophi TaxID=640031 RepID=UPI00215CAD71|nr:hypothetical protein [Streptococcus zalophi]MCR8967544.1 hypothetical protein [Streptococcus zalophi]